MTIYLIADNRYDDEWREWVETPDLDLGYFTTAEAAQSFCDVFNAPVLAANDAAEAKFQNELDEYHKDQAEAKRLGYRTNRTYPARPSPRNVVTVVEVKSGETS